MREGFAPVRQVFLHIVPGSGSYGSPFLGLHFYTWALIGFIGVILFFGVMLFAGASRDHDEAAPPGAAATLAMIAFALMVATNVAVGFAECGVGQCPDNPTGYWRSAPARCGTSGVLTGRPGPGKIGRSSNAPGA